MDNSNGGSKGKIIKNYSYDVTKTYGLNLKSYELDD